MSETYPEALSLIVAKFLHSNRSMHTHQSGPGKTCHYCSRDGVDAVRALVAAGYEFQPKSDMDAVRALIQAFFEALDAVSLAFDALPSSLVESSEP